MSEERKTSAGMSLRRIVGAATGAVLALFGAFWIALPFVILDGLGPGSKMEGDFLTPAF
jgi:hypothetical protein